MVCCCSMAGTKACEHCSNNNNMVSSMTYHYIDLRDYAADWYEKGYQQAKKDIENEGNKSVFN